MRPALMLALFGLIIVPIVAKAKDTPPIPLAKTGAWVMNYDDNACHLMAQFGEGSEQINLRITRVAPADEFDLVLAGPSLKSSGPRGNVTVSFPPAKPVEMEQTALLGTVGTAKKVPMVHLTGIRFDGTGHRADAPWQPVPAALEEGIKSIIFGFGRKKFELKTGSMAPPMASMRTCLSDLVRHWGYDPEQQAKLQRPPTPLSSPGTWLTSKDYPIDSRHQSGLVRFRLDVSETGQITGCKILQKTNPDSFAEISCKLIVRRGKFSPALDSEGKPIKAFYASAVKWMSGY